MSAALHFCLLRCSSFSQCINLFLKCTFKTLLMLYNYEMPNAEDHG